ncbi:MAG: iron-containing alcohol dehydrogenase [Gemmobacter sp.]
MTVIPYLSRVQFADRALDEALGEELAALGVARPLVLTDPVGAAALGGAGEIAERLRLALSPAVHPVHRAVSDDVATGTAAARAVAAFEKGRCDGVVGLGGGAALDLARIVGVTGGEPGRLAAVLSGAAGPAALRRRRIPVALVPVTTANGAGLCPGLRLTDDAERRTLSGDGLIPTLVLCDPTLTLAQPPAATAAAGMDVIAHCIEAFLATAWNPPADGIALEGLRRAAPALPRAVADGADLDARREMLAAALCAGLAAQKGLGGVHALAHAFEVEAAEVAAPHGRLHAALLPPCLAFNAPAVGERFDALREALRLPPGAGLADSLAALAARLALPTRLAPLGLDPALCDRVALAAEAEPANRTNPRYATARDYRQLIAAAM